MSLLHLSSNAMPAAPPSLFDPRIAALAGAWPDGACRAPWTSHPDRAAIDVARLQRGSVRAVLLKELESLELAAGVAPLVASGPTSSESGVAYALRRRRALRALEARAALERLSPLWRGILLVDHEDAERLCRRLGRRIRRSVADGGASNLGSEAIGAIEAAALAIARQTDADTARGLAALAALWRARQSAEASAAIGIARSTIGSALHAIAAPECTEHDLTAIELLAVATLRDVLDEPPQDPAALSHGAVP